MAGSIHPCEGVRSKNLFYSSSWALSLRQLILTSFLSALVQWTGGGLIFILINDLSSTRRQDNNKCITDIGMKLIIYM